jgi:small nuclear ribonucleoprotein (snRNP)-like protein
MIEQIGRFDIIDDLKNIILSDAKQYLKNKIEKNYKSLGKIFLKNITQKINLLFKLLIFFS